MEFIDKVEDTESVLGRRLTTDELQKLFNAESGLKENLENTLPPIDNIHDLAVRETPNPAMLRETTPVETKKAQAITEVEEAIEPTKPIAIKGIADKTVHFYETRMEPIIGRVTHIIDREWDGEILGADIHAETGLRLNQGHAFFEGSAQYSTNIGPGGVDISGSLGIEAGMDNRAYMRGNAVYTQKIGSLDAEISALMEANTDGRLYNALEIGADKNTPDAQIGGFEKLGASVIAAYGHNFNNEQADQSFIAIKSEAEINAGRYDPYIENIVSTEGDYSVEAGLRTTFENVSLPLGLNTSIEAEVNYTVASDGAREVFGPEQRLGSGFGGNLKFDF